MGENQQDAIEKAESSLTEREAHAYRVWQGSARPPLAPSLNAKLYALYLNGKTTEEIRRLNQQLTLGDIVAARVSGHWDDRRQEFLEHLLDHTTERVQQATLQTAELLCDLLTAADVQHGDKLRRFIQTGDEKELGDLKITTLGGLKAAVEILQKLTGQDRQKSVSVFGEVIHRQPESAQPTPAKAEQALKLLVGRKKES